MPALLFEHWLSTPEALKVIQFQDSAGKTVASATILEHLKAPQTKDLFDEVGYLLCVLIDLNIHIQTPISSSKVTQASRNAIDALSCPDCFAPRYPLTSFPHLFCGDTYAASYYVYYWSDAIADEIFAAFEASGDYFDPKLSSSLRSALLSVGGTHNLLDQLTSFIGSPPKCVNLNLGEVENGLCTI